MEIVIHSKYFFVEKYFTGQILIANINGHVDVVTFRSTAAKILQNFQNRKASDNTELEKVMIMKASPDIKNEIKQSNNFGPTVE